MNANYRQRWARLWHAEFCSPKDFLRRAAMIGVAFLVAQIAGLREYTSFLSGTVVWAAAGWKLTVFLGLLYLLLYFTIMLLVPILIIAAVVQHLLLRFFSRPKC
ncbi:MAG TPA: hypothetical protein VEL06_15865 [Haliangiales bacterium]|nr:hypothetical protein [Haliangiales bacterium]